MWKALRRAGEQVPRCRVQRLMKSNGIRARSGAASRGGRPNLTRRRRAGPISSSATSHAAGPNELWVADISLSALLGRARLLRVRARRLQPDDRRLAARRAHAHRPRPRRAQDGARATRAGRRRRTDPSQRPRLAVHEHRLHPDARRPSCARVGRIGRRRLRQRARRVVRRQLQDRADRRPRLATRAASSSSPSSSTSAGTTPPACTRASATSRPSNTSSSTDPDEAITLVGATA